MPQFKISFQLLDFKLKFILGFIAWFSPCSIFGSMFGTNTGLRKIVQFWISVLDWSPEIWMHSMDKPESSARTSFLAEPVEPALGKWGRQWLPPLPYLTLPYSLGVGIMGYGRFKSSCYAQFSVLSLPSWVWEIWEKCYNLWREMIREHRFRQ